MTYNLTVLIIPALAIGYLFLVYALLMFAKRTERRSRPET